MAATEGTATSAPDPLLGAGRLEREAARARTEQLFLEHGRMVDGLCRGLLRDRAEAEDAAQQTFLSAYKALLRGSVPREPAAWLAAIARNECIGRIRERMRQPLAVEDADTVVAAADPLAEALRRADLAALWAAISALAPQQREALLLREFGGLSYDQLGVALGVSVPAVESLLFRARTRLRGELKAALAAVNGAGWVSLLRDLLPKLLGAGGAAKVAAATVGASVLAGGAIVGEHELARPAHPHPRHARTTAIAAAVPAPVHVAAATFTPTATATPHRRRRHVVLPPEPLVLPAATARDDSSGRDGRDRGGESRDGGGGDDTLATGSGRDSGEGRHDAATTGEDGGGDTTGTGDTGGSTETSVDGGGGDSSSSSTSGDGGSGGGDGSGSSGSSGSGSDQGPSGGDTATVTIGSDGGPALTVTAPSGGEH